MATNKNQHFVPRCYLRLFTKDEAGRAINIFNTDRQLFIQNAPVKNQCSKNYFYGEDNLFEHGLQLAECEYSDIVLLLQKHPRELSDSHRLALKRFWLLQYLRTEAASQRTIDMFAGIGKKIDSDDPVFHINAREAARMAMEQYAANINIVDDLKVCILRNKTRVPFVTSDDPAILTNRWQFQDKRVLANSFGVDSAGALILLPISPRLLCIGYDGDVYAVSNSKGFAYITDSWDIKVLNEHQYLNCCANIFVQSSSDEHVVSECYREAKSRRPHTRNIIQYAIPDDSYQSIRGSKQYIVVDPENTAAHQKALIHTQTIHAKPSAWPRFLRWRVNGKVFTNGSGAGYVRRPRASCLFGWREERSKKI